MAKRFTDTEKWKKPFIKNLKCCYKLLWLYICDDCDHAGVWQVDFEIARIRIGENINEQEALKLFGDKVQSFDNGNKWFIPSFIEFQYPSGLSETNRAHTSILALIKKYNLCLITESSPKPLASPLQGAKDMDKDKDYSLIEEIDIKKTIEFTKIVTGKILNQSELLEYWKAFLLHTDEDYKTYGDKISHFRNWLKGQVHTKRVSREKKLVL